LEILFAYTYLIAVHYMLSLLVHVKKMALCNRPHTTFTTFHFANLAPEMTITVLYDAASK